MAKECLDQLERSTIVFSKTYLWFNLKYDVDRFLEENEKKN